MEHNGEEYELTLPRRCMHCVNPPCVKLCPWGSAKQLENGISRIDPDICLGGSKCKDVCPWDIPQRQTGVGLYLKLLPELAGNGVMYKCDRCYDRIAAGELPACIDACPEEVQTIGPRHEMIAKAHAIAEEIGGYVYGESENGGTNTIYVSPVPFEKLNRAVTAGDGAPHLGPVADAMADANHLAAAMVVAPVAGIAAAALRFSEAGAGETGRAKERSPGMSEKDRGREAFCAVGQGPLHPDPVLHGADRVRADADLQPLLHERHPRIGLAGGFLHHAQHPLRRGGDADRPVVLRGVTDFVLSKRPHAKLNPNGWARAALLTAIGLSGALVVVKNFPYVHFSDGFIIAVDLFHLAAAMAF